VPSPENTPQPGLFAVKDLSRGKFVTEFARKEATHRDNEEECQYLTPILRIDMIVPKDDPYVLMFDSLDYGSIQLDARNVFCGNAKATGLGRYIIPNPRKSNVVFTKKPERKSTRGFSVRSGLTIKAEEEIFR
jgi:hypothetical protein